MMTGQTVDFSSNFQTIVVGHQVTFEARHTAPSPYSYQWGFPGGTPVSSNATNPVVIYNNPGRYDVSLIITSGGNAVSTAKSQYIRVIPNEEYHQLSGFENNHWLFADGVHMEFDTASLGLSIQPIPFQFIYFESYAAVSNSDGNLLIYGHGMKLYNRNHQQMLNAGYLYGSPSSTQGLVILPKPPDFQNGLNQNHGLYYVFNTSAPGYLPQGFYYSVADMKLAGGLGAIAPGANNKNVLIRKDITEKMVAVLHRNKKDYWILVHEYPGDKFLAYLLTKDGLNINPVISPVGFNYDSAVWEGEYTGEMAVSGDGTKLAVVITRYSEKPVEIYRFNNQTGIVDSAVTIPNALGLSKYGLEFSPSGRFLYYTSAYRTLVRQIDLESPLKTVTTLINQYPGQAGIAERGPDGKIYTNFFNRNQQPTDGTMVINYPDSAGLACGLQLLTTPTGTIFGLHNNIPCPPFQISGMVRDTTGLGIGGVEIRDGNTILAITDSVGASVGHFAFDRTVGWSGTITPVLQGMTFLPVSRCYTRLHTHYDNQDFLADPFVQRQVAGTVYGYTGVMNDVLIRVTDLQGSLYTPDASVYTDTNGRYSFQIRSVDSARATPEKLGYNFVPPYREYLSLQANQEGQDYNAKPMILIAGRIRPWTVDLRLDEATLTCSNGIPGNPPAVMTGPDGYYEIVVPEGWSGTITAAKPGRVFRSTVSGPCFLLDHNDYFHVMTDMKGQDFIITPW